MKKEVKTLKEEDYKGLVDKYLQQEETANKEQMAVEQLQQHQEQVINQQTAIQQQHQQDGQQQQYPRQLDREEEEDEEESIDQEEYERQLKIQQWEKIQELKIEYNSLFENNQFTKAKIINIEKENYNYLRQITHWDIQNKVSIDGDNQMKIDSQTIQRIVKDNSFSVVKLKKKIQRLNQVLEGLEEEVAGLNGKLQGNIENEQLFERVCKSHLECVLTSTLGEDDQLDYLHKKNNHLKMHFSDLQKYHGLLLQEKQEILFQKNNNDQQVKQLKVVINKQEAEAHDLSNKIESISQELCPTKKTSKLLSSQKKPKENIKQDDVHKKNKLIQENNNQIQELSFNLQEQQRKNILLKQDLLKQINEQQEKSNRLQEGLIDLKVYLNQQIHSEGVSENECNTSIKKSIKSNIR